MAIATSAMTPGSTADATGSSTRLEAMAAAIVE